MFRSGPVDTGGAGGGLLISRGAHRVFDPTPDQAVGPAVRTYLSDMAGPYGLALREDLLDDGAGPSFGEMAERLIETLASEEPVDLLVLAHGIHDARLGRATATYLSSRCPGDPLAFAVCDQGVAAAFSALRVMCAYAATAACRRALLVVVEQPVLHYELAEPAPVPDRHAAVTLMLEETTGSNPLEVRQRAAVPSGEVPTLLAADVAALSGGRSDVTLILGNDLAAVWGERATVDEVLVAPAGQPYTGVWCELSRGLRDWRERERLVLVADYDVLLGYLCTAAATANGPNLAVGSVEGGASRWRSSND